jgi:outer membrane protein assembly factor BamB
MGRGATRRTVLSTVGLGVVGSLAGCRGVSTTGDDDPVPGGWPMAGHDAANTGVSPDAPGPSGPGVRWRFPVERGVTGAPTVVGGIVYLGTLEGSTYGVDAATGDPLWRERASYPVFGSPAVADGTVYVGDGGGYLHALAEGGRTGAGDGERSPGEFLWQTKGDAGFTASPTVADGTVFLGTYEGDLHAFDATDGSQRWVDVLGDNVDVAPAVVDGTVYVIVPRGVVSALDAATGELVWQTALHVGLTRDPAVWNGSVYVGSTETSRYGRKTRLFSLDAATGEREWDAPLEGGISGSPALTDGLLLVGTWGGVLHAFDAATGSERWRTDLGRGLTGAPAVAGGTAYVGTLGRELHAVAVSDGRTRWTVDTAPGVPQSSAVAGDAVYVSTDRPELLAVGT